MEVARKVLLGLSWLYVLGVFVQVFLAGYAMLGGGGSFDAHAALGYMGLHLTPVLMVIAAAVARVPRPLLVVTIVFAVIAFVQPIWVAEFRGEFLGSFHVLGALVLFALAHHIAQKTTRLVRAGAA